MGQKEQKELAELRQMGDRIEEVKSFIANANRIRADIRQRQDNVAKNKNIVADVDEKINGLEKEIDEVQSQHKDKTGIYKNLHDANEIYENRKRIHAIKLEVLLRNKEIKEFLDKLINSNTNIDNLSDLMDSKITNEEKLMLLMNQYNEESANMDVTEGKTIVDIESVTSDFMKDKIERDRENFKRIMEKYLGLKKVVDEYEDPDLEISNLKIKIAEIDNKKHLNTIEQNRAKGDIDKLDKILSKLQDQLNTLKDKRNQIQTAVDQDEAYINDKEAQFVDAEIKLKDLQNQKAVLDEKYKVR